jgi:hypothetical protein
MGSKMEFCPKQNPLFLPIFYSFFRFPNRDFTRRFLRRNLLNFFLRRSFSGGIELIRNYRGGNNSKEKYLSGSSYESISDPQNKKRDSSNDFKKGVSWADEEETKRMFTFHRDKTRSPSYPDFVDSTR